MLSGLKPKRGANAFVILADNSQSMLIRDGGDSKTRGDWLRDRLAKEAPWKTRLEQDFDVRRYAFDSHLRAVDGFETLAFDGVGSSLTTALQSLSKRFRGLPIAGVLVFTDGTRTDLGELDGGLVEVDAVAVVQGDVGLDPLQGEGIAPAMISARLAAEASAQVDERMRGRGTVPAELAGMVAGRHALRIPSERYEDSVFFDLDGRGKRRERESLAGVVQRRAQRAAG